MAAAALTILLSSFLLFLVQPIIAKQILPWFGGSAGVWTVCLVFFQTVLVLGYAYAHLLARGRMASRQFVPHIALLLGSLTSLPIIASAFWKPGNGAQPALRILSLLLTTVGLPYFLLASTAPLIQRWLSTADSFSSRDRSIYRLFALSNLGSLLGLLCYPFAIEPWIPLRAQAYAWSTGYLAFVGCSIGYAWSRWSKSETANLSVEDGPATIASAASPGVALYAYWIGCAALGSILLLSVTNQITQNVASVPLLWLVPLSLYLLSFTICFQGHDGRGWYQRRLWVAPAMLFTAAMAWALLADRVHVPVAAAILLFTAGMFVGCMVCHGELALTKPEPAHLTHFYLSVAAGGALGGLLVGMVAPLIFDAYWEMPLALIALSGLLLYCTRQEARSSTRIHRATNAVLWGLGLTAFLCTLYFSGHYYRVLSADTRYSSRNFYGTLRVTQSPYDGGHIRYLTHGTILHGSQVMQLPLREEATTYFGKSSGIGRAIACADGWSRPLRIGSIGLGIGTLAAYARSGDVFRVYELNPAVIDVAETEFRYLKDSKAEIQLVLGDARLSLEQEIAQGRFDRPEQRFDVLSVDAFSGDAIPVHLLTREAFDIYARVTRPDGIIAFHLSNRFLNLPPLVARIAQDARYHVALIADRPPAGSLMRSSDWLLVTRNTAALSQPEISGHTKPVVALDDLPVWTDQFTNLVRILK
jgi:SAM-dependent methyltransferase